MDRSGTVLLNKMLRGLGIVLSMMISSAATTRGIRIVDQLAFGLREVDSTFANAQAFTNPITGEVKFGA